MSLVFTYISTKSTNPPYVATRAVSLPLLARDVSDGFMALSGGFVMVGEIKQFPLQRSVAGFLLCDGREVAKAAFPELYEFLADTQGISTDADYFVLPNYLGAGALEPAEIADTEIETVVEGTVSMPDPDPPAPGEPEEVFPLFGDVDSGGRFSRINEL